ncbi:MAG TPA: hypothetical protein VMC42_00120 [Methanoregulaceae archaeon]|nr:hypothetical protein [Methanoregulaceae archaeon]
MDKKKILLITLLALLVSGGFGTIPALAASGQDVFGSEWMSGVYFTDPSFLSPDWKAPAVTSTFADPAFLSKDWAVPNLNNPSAAGSPDLSRLTADPSFLSSGWKVPTVSPIADPGILSPNWTVPTITPVADSKFTSANWSVPAVVPFGYGSLPANWPYATPDPFKGDSQFGPEWHLSGYLF